MPIAWNDPHDPLQRPGNVVRPVFEYPVDEYIRQLQPYKHHPGYQRTLELLYKLSNTGSAYLYHSWAVPRGAGAQLNFGIYETKTFAIQMPPGTFITMINGWHSEDEGFIYNITDKGGKVTYIDNDMVQVKVGAGEFVANSVNPPSDGDVVPFGGGLISAPLIVVEPGQLTVEITSLADATQNIQLFLACAVPVTSQSTGVVIPRSV